MKSVKLPSSFKPLSAAEGIRAAMTRDPGKIAMTCGSKQRTYGELVRRIDALSAFLLDGLGVKTKQHGAIIAANCMEYLEITAGGGPGRRATGDGQPEAKSEGNRRYMRRRGGPRDFRGREPRRVNAWRRLRHGRTYRHHWRGIGPSSRQCQNRRRAATNGCGVGTPSLFPTRPEPRAGRRACCCLPGPGYSLHWGWPPNMAAIRPTTASWHSLQWPMGPAWHFPYRCCF